MRVADLSFCFSRGIVRMQLLSLLLNDFQPGAFAREISEWHLTQAGEQLFV
jgi:hypothetical protein